MTEITSSRLMTEGEVGEIDVIDKNIKLLIRSLSAIFEDIRSCDKHGLPAALTKLRSIINENDKTMEQQILLYNENVESTTLFVNWIQCKTSDFFAKRLTESIGISVARIFVQNACVRKSDMFVRFFSEQLLTCGRNTLNYNICEEAAKVWSELLKSDEVIAMEIICAMLKQTKKILLFELRNEIRMNSELFDEVEHLHHSFNNDDDDDDDNNKIINNDNCTIDANFEDGRRERHTIRRKMLVSCKAVNELADYNDDNANIGSDVGDLHNINNNSNTTTTTTTINSNNNNNNNNNNTDNNNKKIYENNHVHYELGNENDMHEEHEKSKTFVRFMRRVSNETNNDNRQSKITQRCQERSSLFTNMTTNYFNENNSECDAEFSVKNTNENEDIRYIYATNNRIAKHADVGIIDCADNNQKFSQREKGLHFVFTFLSQIKYYPFQHKIPFMEFYWKCISLLFFGEKHCRPNDVKQVRIAAAEALTVIMKLAYNTYDISVCQLWQNFLLFEIFKLIQENKASSTAHFKILWRVDNIYCALLVVNALLKAITVEEKSERPVDWANYKREQINEIWKFINDHLLDFSLNVDVRKELFASLPLLAACDECYFASRSMIKLQELLHVVFTSANKKHEQVELFRILPLIFAAAPSLYTHKLTICVNHANVLTPSVRLIMSYIEQTLYNYDDLTALNSNDDDDDDKKESEYLQCSSAVTCLTALARNFPHETRQYISLLIEPLFNNVLTPIFALNLATICNIFPEYRSICLANVLHQVKLNLIGTSELVRDNDRRKLSERVGEQRRNYEKEQEENERILNNLRLLSKFDFTGYSTLPFLCEVVLRYTTHPCEEIRLNAIEVCFKLIFSSCTHLACRKTTSSLLHNNTNFEYKLQSLDGQKERMCEKDEHVLIHFGEEHIYLINKVVTSLISCAVMDSSSRVRVFTLQKFSAAFDSTLALNYNIQRLQSALFGEQSEKLLVIRLFGRLSALNPSCIYTILSDTLSQIIVDMKYLHEQSRSSLLCNWLTLSYLIDSGSTIIKPYVYLLLPKCVESIQSPQTHFSLLPALLSCVGKLVHLSSANNNNNNNNNNISNHSNNVNLVRFIQPHVIQQIVNPVNLAVKHEAIKALAPILQFTRELEVYATWPHLFNELTSSLRGNHGELRTMQMDILRLLGIIGAVAPTQIREMKQITEFGGINKSTFFCSPSSEPSSSSLSSSSSSSSLCATLLSNESLQHDAIEILRHLENEMELTPLIVSELLLVLSDMKLSNSKVYLAAMATLDKIIEWCGNEINSFAPLYGKIINALLHLAHERSEISYKVLLKLDSLLTTFNAYSAPHYKYIINALAKFISIETRPDCIVAVWHVMAQLRYVLGAEFKEYVFVVVERTVNVICSSKESVIKYAFVFLTALAPLLKDVLHIVLPCVLDIVCGRTNTFVDNNTDAVSKNSNVILSLSCRTEAVNLITLLAITVPNFINYAPRCIYCLRELVFKLKQQQPQEQQQKQQQQQQEQPPEQEREGKWMDVDNKNVNTNSCYALELREFYWATANAFVTVSDNDKSINNYFAHISSPMYTPTVRNSIWFDEQRMPNSEVNGSNNVWMGQQTRAERCNPETLLKKLEYSEAKAIRNSTQNANNIIANENNDNKNTKEYTAATAAAGVAVINNNNNNNMIDPLTLLSNGIGLHGRVSYSAGKDWIERLSISLLQHNPFMVLKQTCELAQLHVPFAHRLFHVAFAIYYYKLEKKYQLCVVDYVNTLLKSLHIPMIVLQTLLNLAEFIEHVEIRYLPMEPCKELKLNFPFNADALIIASKRCKWYSKTIHYMEILFDAEICEFTRCCAVSDKIMIAEVEKRLVHVRNMCIELYNFLGYNESAWGVQIYLEKNFRKIVNNPLAEMHQIMDSSLISKLRCWSQSVSIDFAKIEGHRSVNVQNKIQRLRTLDNTGNYNQLLNEWKVLSKRTSPRDARELAPYGAYAAWLLRSWEDLREANEIMPDEGYAGTTAAFYRATLAIRYEDNIKNAQLLINECRERLLSTMSTLLAESYDRAYALFVGLQQLSELEEFILLRQGVYNKGHWQELWDKRLYNMKYEGWPGTLANHSLLLTLTEELPAWLHFASSSRTHGKPAIGYAVLCELLQSKSIVEAFTSSSTTTCNFASGNLMVGPHPMIALAALQHEYETGHRKMSVRLLQQYLITSESNLITDLRKNNNDNNHTLLGTKREDVCITSFARCYVQLAEWACVERENKVDHHDIFYTNPSDHAARQHRVERELGVCASNKNVCSNTERSSLRVIEHTFREFDQMSSKAFAEKTMRYLEQATKLISTNGSIWHVMAHVYYKLVSIIKKELTEFKKVTHKMSTNLKENDNTEKISVIRDRHDLQKVMSNCILRAMKSYLHSIEYNERIEDILGFLSLWFDYLTWLEVNDNKEITSHVMRIKPVVWCKAIPQLVARICGEDVAVCESVKKLLVHIGRTHPQALLYNLNVYEANSFESDFINYDNCHCYGDNVSANAKPSVEHYNDSLNNNNSKNNNNNNNNNVCNEDDNRCCYHQDSVNQYNCRKWAVKEVLDKITEQNEASIVLIRETRIVCTELVRCSVLWVELWCYKIDDWFQALDEHKDIKLFACNLHKLTQCFTEPETEEEKRVMECFGKELFALCEQIWTATMNNSSSNELEALLELLQKLLSKMYEYVKHMTCLSLQCVSSELYEHGSNLSIAVPGQYNTSNVFPCIFKFKKEIGIIKSKQNPRKLEIIGNNGISYKFLLKGHEDLRLDERVMQLLKLVNVLLAEHTTIRHHDSAIQTYSVTPLSNNAGLIGWVEHCNTLNKLICRYREDNVDYLRREIQAINEFCHISEKLPRIHCAEAFECAMNATEGNDLARSMWISSISSEKWLKMRTTYTCSLATMSIVGYVLGLGDRHLENMMLHNSTGRIVHIDYGDCFDVARTRKRFPEHVPFRLTRMLTRAMEVCDYYGYFEQNCINVMRLLQEETNNIFALLQVFVHDPLIDWQNVRSKTSKEYECKSRKIKKLVNDQDDESNIINRSVKGIKKFSRRSERSKEFIYHGDNNNTNNNSDNVVESIQIEPHKRLEIQEFRQDVDDNASIIEKEQIMYNNNLEYKAETCNMEQNCNVTAENTIKIIKKKLKGAVYTNEYLTNHTLPCQYYIIDKQINLLIKEAKEYENLSIQYDG